MKFSSFHYMNCSWTKIVKISDIQEVLKLLKIWSYEAWLFMNIFEQGEISWKIDKILKRIVEKPL